MLLDQGNILGKISFSDITDSWDKDLGPVINQGSCAKCWSVSFTEVLTGIANRYMPDNVKEYYAREGLNDRIVLSSDMVT